MNRTEVAKVLAVVAERYRHAKFGDDAESLVTAWHVTLDDVPYDAAMVALRAWFKAEKWAPDPSELRGRILSGLSAVPDEAEAWALVLRHMRSTYGPFGTPFVGPEPVRLAVEAIGGWWALRTSEQPTRDREAFGRVYPVYAKRALSDLDVAALLGGEATPAVADGNGRPWWGE